MADKLYVVTDLGPGDGGKGSVVHFLANKFHAPIVIKEGGAQGSHGVVTSSGEKFNFSQWGCGTLEGILTYLSERFIISPIGLIKEADALKHCQISNPFKLLLVNPSCLIATPYHQAWSQLDELLRRDKPRGTVGVGVGKAHRESIECPNIALYADDLAKLTPIELANRLTAQRSHALEVLGDLSVDDVLPKDRELFLKNYNLLTDETGNVLCDIVGKFHAVGSLLNFCELREVLARSGTIVVERSHGVLTDSRCGFKPHVSAIRTLPKFSEYMYRNAGFTGEIHHLAVHRAYEIRHGAGPMPSFDPSMNNLLPGSHKDSNRFQGEVRIGPLDIPLLRYALDQCKDTPFDCLCITWFDQIMQSGVWSFCTDYYVDGQLMTDYNNLAESIFNVSNYKRYDLSVDTDKYQEASYFLDFVADTMRQFVDLPVRLVSYGATELDKIIK